MNKRARKSLAKANARLARIHLASAMELARGSNMKVGELLDVLLNKPKKRK